MRRILVGIALDFIEPRAKKNPVKWFQIKYKLTLWNY